MRLSSGVLALLQNRCPALWELSLKHHSGKLSEVAGAHALRSHQRRRHPLDLGRFGRAEAQPFRFHFHRNRAAGR